jgi:hypothetical protein
MERTARANGIGNERAAAEALPRAGSELTRSAHVEPRHRGRILGPFALRAGPESVRPERA